MDFNKTVDLIIRELNEAVEIIEDLKSYQNVPFLQIELAKSKCRNAAEVIRLLKNLQENLPLIKENPEPKVTPEKQVTEKPVTSSEKREKADQKQEKGGREPEIPRQKPEMYRPEPEAPRQKPEMYRPEPEAPRKEPEAPFQEPETFRQKPVRAKGEPQKISGERTESKTLGDTFGQRIDRLNEKIGVHKEDDDIRDIIKSKPITNLSEAIGINDKFLFIRELFDGNSELYNKTISSLDSSGSFDDASSIVMNFSGDDTSNKAAKQLMELVKRKFQVNE